MADRTADQLEADFPRGDSAVLGLIEHDGDFGRPGLVLTRRRADLRTDPGFAASVGGRIDQGETAVDTARDLTAWLGGHDRREHARRQRELDHFAAARWVE